MGDNDYIPDEDDIVWLNFTVQSGFEQAGRRLAVVLSPKSYNGRTGLMLCVPATTQVKGYPFEVALDDEKVSGVALSDQIKSKVLIGKAVMQNLRVKFRCRLWRKLKPN